MNILLVGGAGYIGSHVVHDLRGTRLNRPVVLDNLSTGFRAAVPSGTVLVRGSYGNRSLVQRVLKKYRIRAVVHFGAQSIVEESVKYPERYWQSNVVDSLNLFEAMRTTGVNRLVFSSSASVYGDPKFVPIREDHPRQPTTPYGHTKLAVELMLEDYVRRYGFSVCSLRYFNAAGAYPKAGLGEWHAPETHLIPLVLRHALGEFSPITVYGTDYPTFDGTAIRDYVHVQDLSRAHVLALRTVLKYGTHMSTYNVGYGRGYSVMQVLKAAEQVTGKALRVRMKARRAGDPSRLVAAIGKIRKDLGWRPQLGLKSILTSAWEWHQNHPTGYS